VLEIELADDERAAFLASIEAVRGPLATLDME
jgi:hypothetical protein